ncbi:hypothetical protein FA13DRAFT_1730598 [Coprinellus micaceus]|uniref:Uncharacterized protein n=1 Tax=Coprinellus micaceus TaxID=71717 RepID=A0A4Y7THB0_COPMI|nr:hypothetical protein FA13DRAFT_1730598 [Coprinellus micaceus]
MSWSTEPITKLLYALDSNQRLLRPHPRTRLSSWVAGRRRARQPYWAARSLGSTLALILLIGFLSTRDDASGLGLESTGEGGGGQERGGEGQEGLKASTTRRC